MDMERTVTMAINLPRRLPEAVVALTMGMLPLAAPAMETTGSVSAGVGVSDNLTRSTTKKYQAIGTLGVQFGAKEKTRRLLLDVDTDLSYLDYPGSVYKGEVVGHLHGETVLAIVPERLNWMVKDVFGQTRRSLYDVITPSNRENVNYFSTGPRAIIGLGDVANLLIAGTYTRNDHELTQLNSQQYGADIGIERRLSASSTLGLHASHDRIEPDPSSGIEPYDRESAYLNYALMGANTTVNVNGGASRLLLNGATFTGPRIEVEVQRQLGSGTQVFFTGGRQFTDEGAQMGSSYVARWAPTLDTASQTRSVESFRRTHAGSGLGLSGAHTSMVVDFTWNEDNFETNPTLDRRRLTARSIVHRQLFSRLGASAGGTWSTDSYVNSGQGLRELSVNAGLDLRITRNLFADLDYNGYRTNPISSGAIAGTENRVWLRLRYGVSRGLLGNSSSR
jgi:hypothetical protein